ncbi:hypothetical protein SLS62_011115 [Diatrype stigma]|uniref:AB hydrolase-1 domain-containing protein n=1 Tax=Diatrype stigma TaxID=117547 RepID=A0AAN9UCP2_9PEZI
MSNASETQRFLLGDFPLQSGATLRDAFVAYKTFGDRSLPAVVYPTWFSGAIAANEWLVGDDMALSPRKYFIVIPALFGNGESTSPSNYSNSGAAAGKFPDVTFYDNVKAQHRLLTEGLGIKSVKAVLGWSMGAGQTYQWITQYPNFAERAIPFCGSARTSPHNQVFLEGVKSALLAAKGAASGGSGQGEAATSQQQYRAWTAEEREVGLKALGRVYAGWGLSQAFYREKLYETALGFAGLEDFLKRFWEGWALSKGG